MTIEPSNTNPITIWTLIHENKSLKSTLEILTREHDDLQKRHIQQFEDYEKRIKVQQHLILRAQEEQKRAVDQNNYAHSRLTTIMKERDVALAKLESISNANKTATEASEMQTLKNAYAFVQSVRDELWNQLNAERDAHNKLKALCNERGFGTPLHPINQPRTLPPWSVDFPTKDHGTVTILFCNPPSVARLDDLQERLEATGWTLTYNGFKQ